MTNKIFIDSSVLIEPLQKRKVEFYKRIVLKQENICCINSIVVSEYLYKYIGLQNLGSPRQVQSDNKITEALQPYFITKTLKEFLFIESGEAIVSLVPDLMSRYNLLPNDAIILATCKLHGIKNLASHDKDFEIPCKAEGIDLVSD